MTDNDHKASWEESLEHLRKERTRKPEHGSQRKTNSYLSEFDAAFDAALESETSTQKAEPIKKEVEPTLITRTKSITQPENQITQNQQKPSLATSPSDKAKERSGLTIEPVEPLDISKARPQSKNEEFYTYDTLDTANSAFSTIEVTSPEFTNLSLGKDDSNLSLSETGKHNEDNEIISSLTISTKNEDSLSADKNLFSSQFDDTENGIDFSFENLSVELESTLSNETKADIKNLSHQESEETTLEFTQPEEEEEYTLNVAHSNFSSPKKHEPSSYENTTPETKDEITLAYEPLEHTTSPTEATEPENNNTVEVEAFDVPESDIVHIIEETKEEANITEPKTIDFDELNSNQLEVIEYEASEDLEIDDHNEVPFVSPSIFSIPIFSIDREAANSEEDQASISNIEVPETNQNLTYSAADFIEQIDLPSHNEETKPSSIILDEEQKTPSSTQDNTFMDVLSPIFTIDEDPDFLPEDNEIINDTNPTSSVDNEEITYSIEEFPSDEEEITYTIDTLPAFKEDPFTFEFESDIAALEEPQQSETSSPEKPIIGEAQTEQLNTVEEENHKQTTDLSEIILQDHVLDALAEKLAEPIQEAIIASIRTKLHGELIDIIKDTLKEQIEDNPELLKISK